MWPCPRIAGRVITVRLRRAEPGEHAPRHLGTAAIEAGGPGQVIVIEHHDREDAAGWGGILSLAARLKGIEGVIVDGTCRDVDDSRDASFPGLRARGDADDGARPDRRGVDGRADSGRRPARGDRTTTSSPTGAARCSSPATRAEEVITTAEGLAGARSRRWPTPCARDVGRRGHGRKLRIHAGTDAHERRRHRRWPARRCRPRPFRTRWIGWASSASAWASRRSTRRSACAGRAFTLRYRPTGLVERGNVGDYIDDVPPGEHRRARQRRAPGLHRLGRHPDRRRRTGAASAAR